MRLRYAILLSLAAAGSAAAATTVEHHLTPYVTQFDSDKDHWVAVVWKDPDTGCEYLIRGDTMIPRLSRDGHPRCNP